MQDDPDSSEILMTTPRMRMRRWKREDLDDLIRVYGDPEGMRYVGDGDPADRAECERWIEVTFERYQRYGYGMFALMEKESDAVLGFIGLVHPGGQVEAEAKYAFARDFWGQGLATEALSALLPWGLERFGLPKIIATIDDPHVVSQRVAKKSGMREEGPRLEEDGELTRVFVYP